MTSDEFLAVPRPLITATARPFWEGLAHHRLVIQRCGACSRFVHYPRIRCPHCGAPQLGFEPVAETGRIHTVTIARQATAPHFEAEVPQVLAIVELDCGVRVTTTVVSAAPEALTIGQRVRAVYDDGPDGITLLRFRPD